MSLASSRPTKQQMAQPACLADAHTPKLASVSPLSTLIPKTAHALHTALTLSPVWHTLPVLQHENTMLKPGLVPSTRASLSNPHMVPSVPPCRTNPGAALCVRAHTRTYACTMHVHTCTRIHTHLHHTHTQARVHACARAPPGGSLLASCCGPSCSQCARMKLPWWPVCKPAWQDTHRRGSVGRRTRWAYERLLTQKLLWQDGCGRVGCRPSGSGLAAACALHCWAFVVAHSHASCS